MYIYKYGSTQFANTSTEIKITQKDIYGEESAPGGIGGGDIAAILGMVYLVAGIVAVIAIIIGGVRYVVSAGDSNGIQSAKNTILYAVVGLVVIIAAAAITEFVIKNVAK